jgi:hypothetical protein
MRQDMQKDIEKRRSVGVACAGEIYPWLSQTLPLLEGTDLAGFWRGDQG